MAQGSYKRHITQPVYVNRMYPAELCVTQPHLRKRAETVSDNNPCYYYFAKRGLPNPKRRFYGYVHWH